MIEIKSGYLLKLNKKYYGIVLKDGKIQPEYAIVIPLIDGLNYFVIESYYDENLQLCHKLTDWLGGLNDLTEKDIYRIYDLSSCGRLMDIRNRELLWENSEVFA